MCVCVYGIGGREGLKKKDKKDEIAQPTLEIKS